MTSPTRSFASQPTSKLGVSVVVATYRRPDRLVACLNGLRAQSLAANAVLVVVHRSDSASAGRVAQLMVGWPELRRVQVERHGLVAALNRGLATAQEPIVAFIDDDAVPSVDWLEQIVGVFERDDRVAAVGGRDVMIVDGRVVGARRRRFGPSSRPPQVGRIQCFGRMIGNHHLGAGQARAVDVLKGANMSFRRQAVAHGFDERLRGEGVEVHSELSICLPLRRLGLRIIYDPAIVVLHSPAPRRYGFPREEVSQEAMLASAHNEALEILDYFGPLRRLVFLIWGFAIGTTHAPGVAVLVRDVLRGQTGSWLKFRAAQRGRSAARKTRRTPRRLQIRQDGSRSTDGGDRPRSGRYRVLRNSGRVLIQRVLS